jgi:hypothetical protein
MSVDRKLESDETESEEPDVSRRKLLWAAPLIMTRSLIYASAGCGKGSRFIQQCQRHPSGGS